ncbi:unnamed protein product [Diatraea saccharalis]|uniref:Uncharacterized protein n=1 Tax=Diatraea saccharalis TaxID=40085 RepID=A0A9N9QWQ4_9NEOP|nr:unnamed protein product [Diatraea saccharalis]
MCNLLYALAQTIVCAIQTVIRLFLTILIMTENLIRMILQNAYNLISFLLQLISLLPICIVFIVTSRLKCLLCSGGLCPFGRANCDCLMSIVALAILFFVLRATGVLDKLLNNFGYDKTRSLSSLNESGNMKFQ